jgi:hypothetical protein
MKDKYTGKCYRHVLRFIPSEQFDNNCPACYWESKHQLYLKSQEVTKKDVFGKDVDVRIQNIGGGSFRLMSENDDTH